MNTKKLLMKHEGLRLKPYTCTAGKLSIGYGRNLIDKGITKIEALYLLNNDIAECEEDLQTIFPKQFKSFPANIQSVLISMRFQLGHSGFRKFKLMIIAFLSWDFAEAAKQMRDSAWYEQVPNRARELIKLVEGEL